MPATVATPRKSTPKPVGVAKEPGKRGGRGAPKARKFVVGERKIKDATVVVIESLNNNIERLPADKDDWPIQLNYLAHVIHTTGKTRFIVCHVEYHDNKADRLKGAVYAEDDPALENCLPASDGGIIHLLPPFSNEQEVFSFVKKHGKDARFIIDCTRSKVNRITDFEKNMFVINVLQCTADVKTLAPPKAPRKPRATNAGDAMDDGDDGDDGGEDDGESSQAS